MTGRCRIWNALENPRRALSFLRWKLREAVHVGHHIDAPDFVGSNTLLPLPFVM